MNKFYDDLLEGHDKIVKYTQISYSVTMKWVKTPK